MIPNTFVITCLKCNGNNVYMDSNLAGITITCMDCRNEEEV
jgi:hypothetical protein